MVCMSSRPDSHASALPGPRSTSVDHEAPAPSCSPQVAPRSLRDHHEIIGPLGRRRQGRGQSGPRDSPRSQRRDQAPARASRRRGRFQGPLRPRGARGRWCYGKTPMQTFVASVGLAKEKMIAA